MTFAPTILPCVACGGTSRTFVLRKESDRRRPGPISLQRCTACNTIYLGDASEVYDTDLYAYYHARADWPRERLSPAINYGRYQQLMRWLARKVDARGGGRRILDVGCGMGQFVDAALRAHWHVQGIELASGAVDIARRFGLPVRQLDLFSEELAPGSFDIATMFEVIEHLPQPGNFLHRLESLLRPGGVVYLTTPNFICADRRILGAEWDAIHCEHLAYFTPDTLRSLVERASNLRVVHTETRNISAAALRAMFQRPQDRAAHNRVSAPNRSLPGNGRAAERRLRSLSEASAVARFAKRLANKALSHLQLGNTLVMLLERPD